MKISAVLVFAAMLVLTGPATAAVKVVAAENFYGDIALAVGSPTVDVVSILNNPDQDPHLFEASPTVARQVVDAAIVIYNGAGYDTWMAKLLRVSPRPGRLVIDVAALMGSKPGANPHLWYNPVTMPKVAQALAVALSKIDPDHSPAYRARLKTTLASLARVGARVTALRAKWAGTPVTATEPVFGPMAAAIGLNMRNEAFQRATMNDTEPSARDIAAFEADLKTHKVKVLIFNRQVVGRLTRHMIAVAKHAKVPVVAVSETQPPDTTYRDWMLSELDTLDQALEEAQP